MLKTPSEESVIFWPWEIQGPIEGPAVMVDVLAASHNIIHLSQNARRLFTVTKDSVLDALIRYPDAVLIGETTDPALFDKLRHTFISDNNPIHVVKADVKGKDVIFITNNGTHTISELIEHQANPVIVGHWINIDAVVDYIRRQKDHRIHLVPSGGREKKFEHVGGKLMEDWYCAEAFRDKLLGNSHDVEDDFRRSRDSIAAQYPEVQKDDELDLIFQANKTNVIPLCYPIASGIIEVKA